MTQYDCGNFNALLFPHRFGVKKPTTIPDAIHFQGIFHDFIFFSNAEAHGGETVKTLITCTSTAIGPSH